MAAPADLLDAARSGDADAFEELVAVTLNRCTVEMPVRSNCEGG